MESTSTTNGRLNVPVGAEGYQRHVLTVTSKPFILRVYQRANAMGPWGLLSRAMQGGQHYALWDVWFALLMPCFALLDVFISLQSVARETWSDSCDFPDWTFNDINHDHSKVNSVALQKDWQQNCIDMRKAQTTWFDSLHSWHHLTLGRSCLYLGNEGTTRTWPQMWRVCTQVRWKLRCDFQIASCLMPHLCHVVQLPLAEHFAMPLALWLQGSRWPLGSCSWHT